MNIYYDSEFTGLHQATTLISIGLIAETGERFYAEFSDYNQSQVNEWIKANVIDKRILCHTNGGNGVDLHGFVGDKQFIKDRLESWLSRFNHVQIISDVAHYDFVLFCELFGGAFGLPKNVSPTCHDINQDIAKFLGISEQEAFDFNREAFCGLNIGECNKHNALWDAMIIKECHDRIKRERGNF